MKVREKKKNLLISNLKGLLIFLVVLGHFIEINRQDYNEVFNLIYLFHMPLFIFISGFLAKRVSIQKVVYLVAIYLIFQTFFLWFSWIFGAAKNPFDYMMPKFHLWYLVSLAIWCVGALLISRIKATYWKAGILVLIVIGAVMSRQYTDNVDDLISTYYSGFTSYTLSYQRTLSFAPFFFAGFFLSSQGFEKIAGFIKARSVKIGLLLANSMLFFIWSQSNNKLNLILKGAAGGEKFMPQGATIAEYLLQATLYYTVAAVVCFLVINTVTGKLSVLTKWGDNSLLIYLFHPIFLIILRELHFYQEWSTFTRLLFYGIVSISVTSVLGSQHVANFMNARIFLPVQKGLFGT